MLINSEEEYQKQLVRRYKADGVNRQAIKVFQNRKG